MAFASVRIVMTTSTRAARSAGLIARAAPAFTSGSALSALRFQTVTSWPTSISRLAMAAPMRPNPATPTFIKLSLSFLVASRKSDDQAALGIDQMHMRHVRDQLQLLAGHRHGGGGIDPSADGDAAEIEEHHRLRAHRLDDVGR